MFKANHTKKQDKVMIAMWLREEIKKME